MSVKRSTEMIKWYLQALSLTGPVRVPVTRADIPYPQGHNPEGYNPEEHKRKSHHTPEGDSTQEKARIKYMDKRGNDD